jgi:hypothetical protein
MTALPSTHVAASRPQPPARVRCRIEQFATFSSSDATENRGHLRKPAHKRCPSILEKAGDCLRSASVAAAKARRSRGSSMRARCFLRMVARSASAGAVIALQTSSVVRRKNLGPDGRHRCPSASISSAIADAAASSFASRVTAKRSSSRSHSLIPSARQSCETNGCMGVRRPWTSPSCPSAAPKRRSHLRAPCPPRPSTHAFAAWRAAFG